MEHIPFERFAELLFDSPQLAPAGAEIMQAVLKAGSARWTEIATAMSGSESAAYKRPQRLMESIRRAPFFGAPNAQNKVKT